MTSGKLSEAAYQEKFSFAPDQKLPANLWQQFPRGADAFVGKVERLVFLSGVTTTGRFTNALKHSVADQFYRAPMQQHP